MNFRSGSIWDRIACRPLGFFFGKSVFYCGGTSPETTEVIHRLLTIG